MRSGAKATTFFRAVVCVLRGSSGFAIIWLQRHTYVSAQVVALILIGIKAELKSCVPL